LLAAYSFALRFLQVRTFATLLANALRSRRGDRSTSLHFRLIVGRPPRRTPLPHGRGCGVGRALGLGGPLGVGVGRGVEVGVTVAVAVGEGVAVGVDEGEGVGVGVSTGVGVDEGVGEDEGVGVGEGPWALVIRYSTLWSPLYSTR